MAYARDGTESGFKLNASTLTIKWLHRRLLTIQYREDARMNHEPKDVPMDVPDPLVEVSRARDEPDQTS